jgi:hypothetical protein
MTQSYFGQMNVCMYVAVWSTAFRDAEINRLIRKPKVYYRVHIRQLPDAFPQQVQSITSYLIASAFLILAFHASIDFPVHLLHVF